MFKIELLYHLFVLGSLVVFSGFLAKKFHIGSFKGKIAQGLLFAAITCLLMMYPYILAKGLVFDGRSIVISLCTLFFGPLAGLVPTITALALRIHYGGVGIIMGISVILSSFLIGWFFNNLKIHGKFRMNIMNLLNFGFIVHLIMAGLIFTLPGNFQMATFKFISLTIIIIYPLITLVAGLILTDQEENRGKEIQIRESERKFRLIIQNSSDLLLLLNPDSTIKYISPSVKKMLGYEPEEIIGKKIKDFISDREKLRLIKNQIEEIFNNPGVVLQIEAALLSKDGNTVFVESIAQNLMNEPAINGIIANVRNITERKKYENMLLEKIDELNRFHQVTLNREMDNIDLKKEVNQLLIQLNLDPKYRIVGE